MTFLTGITPNRMAQLATASEAMTDTIRDLTVAPYTHGYQRDHFLVARADLTRAVAALEHAITELNKFP